MHSPKIQRPFAFTVNKVQGYERFMLLGRSMTDASTNTTLVTASRVVFPGHLYVLASNPFRLALSSAAVAAPIAFRLEGNVQS